MTEAAMAEEGSEQRLGDYLLGDLIGEGGMGRVYEAHERLSNRRVAIKVLRDDLARSERARKLFLSEMQILAHLEHPNIVRSLSSIEADGKLAMVLEYLEGKTLRQWLLEEGRIGWDRAAVVGTEVARALSAAHGQTPPVVHRDLKPENIMLLDDGTVRVMDFGIAKLVQELNQTNTQTVGTLQYMSPEQIDAHPTGPQTDLYGLGLVLYELISGRPPFQAESPRKLLNQQCSDPPPEFEAAVGCPRGLRRLVFQLLEKRPEDRPPSAEAVVDALEDFLPAGDSALAEAPAAGAPPKEALITRAKTPLDKRTGDADAKAGPVDPHHDTVALIEATSRGERELSPLAAAIVIGGFAAASAVATYWWKAQQAVSPPQADTVNGAPTVVSSGRTTP